MCLDWPCRLPIRRRRQVYTDRSVPSPIAAPERCLNPITRLVVLRTQWRRLTRSAPPILERFGSTVSPAADCFRRVAAGDRGPDTDQAASVSACAERLGARFRNNTWPIVRRPVQLSPASNGAPHREAAAQAELVQPSHERCCREHVAERSIELPTRPLKPRKGLSRLPKLTRVFRVAGGGENRTAAVNANDRPVGAH